jgi:diguanylate cyclase (GGDEF)-like protein
MKIQQKINLLVAVLAITFWIAHAYFDALLSIEGTSFLESCFAPDVGALLLRGFVVLILLIFGAYAERLVKVINNMARDIKNHQDNIEDTFKQHRMETRERLLALKKLEQLADTDPLTSIFNRRKFEEMLQFEIERNLRYELSLALIMCDIDHFKRINDQFGHDVGDETLKEFSKSISENIRDVDIFARWGGEEFMILMPNATADIANSVAEKLRKLIESTDIKSADCLTASFGVTDFKASDTIDTFIKRADTALYHAKESGRNTVVVIT